MKPSCISYSWLFFGHTWAEKEHWHPLMALWPLEAVKSFISSPCDTGKQPLAPKIVFSLGKWQCYGVKYLASCISKAYSKKAIMHSSPKFRWSIITVKPHYLKIWGVCSPPPPSSSRLEFLFKWKILK